MSGKLLEVQGEPLEITFSLLKGYQLKSLPDVIDIIPEQVKKYPAFYTLVGDSLLVHVGKTSARYHVVKKTKAGKLDWWIAKRVQDE